MWTFIANLRTVGAESHRRTGYDIERSTMLLIGEPSICMGHLYHGYVSHNQRINGCINTVFIHTNHLLMIPIT